MSHWKSLGATDALPPCVYPLNDLRDHEPDSPSCWCKPFLDDGILVHNSMDGREQFERGERRVS